MKPRRNRNKDEDEEQSSDAMSRFDSEASRINFWKDINIVEEIQQDKEVVVSSFMKEQPSSNVKD